ncbi:TSUP family transporter [Actinomycetota bacterium]
MTSLTTVLLLGLALFAGSFVQSSIGFGMAIVAAPFVVLAAPELMPGALLVTTLSLPLVTLAHGPRDIAWRPLGWALFARLLTMPLGVAAVAMLSTRLISALVGVLILITAVASVTTLDIRPTRGAALAAGAVAGVSGTAASIGGPFLAFVLQRESPWRQRRLPRRRRAHGAGRARRRGGVPLAAGTGRPDLAALHRRRVCRGRTRACLPRPGAHAAGRRGILRRGQPQCHRPGCLLLALVGAHDHHRPHR